MKLTGGIKFTDTSADPFERVTATKIHGLHVVIDTELTVAGAGRVRFKALVTNPRTGKTWIDVADSRKRIRSFPVDAVRTVHVIAKTREAAK